MADLIATIGGTVSNSYATTQEATAYFGARPHSEAWADVDDPKASLIAATNLLNWHARFYGQKASMEQALAWPRTGVVDKEGFPVAIDEIPRQIKAAVFEIALASIADDPIPPHDMAGLSEVKVGPLKVVAQKTGVKKYTVPPIVWTILDGMVSNSPASLNSIVMRY